MHTLIELLSLSILHQQTDNCGQTVKKSINYFFHSQKKSPFSTQLPLTKIKLKNRNQMRQMNVTHHMSMRSRNNKSFFLLFSN